MRERMGCSVVQVPQRQVVGKRRDVGEVSSEGRYDGSCGGMDGGGRYVAIVGVVVRWVVVRWVVSFVVGVVAVVGVAVVVGMLCSDLKVQRNGAQVREIQLFLFESRWLKDLADSDDTP